MPITNDCALYEVDLSTRPPSCLPIGLDKSKLRSDLPDYPLLLKGHHLWCKNGFNDGDLLDDYLWEVPEFEATWSRVHKEKKTVVFDDFCLMALVELYLLPLFDRPLELWHASYAHNGTRVTDDEWWDTSAYPGPALPEVTLTGAEILPIMFGMSKAFTSWLDGATTLEFPPQLAQTAREMTKELGVQVVTSGPSFTMPQLEIK